MARAATQVAREVGEPYSVPPLVAAVIIARNEEEHICRCVESVLGSLRGFEGAHTVLVDSRSTDRTVELCRRYPISIVRLRQAARPTAALGRVAGQQLTRSRYVVFVDGDSEINSDWIRAAVTFMEGNRDVAGVGGKLREIYYQHGLRVAENDDFFRMENVVTDVYQLGGNAIYRREALERAGTFNVRVISHEEAELAERLRHAGYRLVRLPVVAAVHHTAPRENVDEYWRRFRAGLQVGFGQVLRLTIGTPHFWEHARNLNRYLLTVAFLGIGFASALASLAFGNPAYAGAWLALAVFFMIAFIIRSRSIRHPFSMVADWFVAAPAITWGFVAGAGQTSAGTVLESIEPIRLNPDLPVTI